MNFIVQWVLKQCIQFCPYFLTYHFHRQQQFHLLPDLLGRLPLAIISHDLVLGKYLWMADEGLLLLSLPPMARRCPSSSAAAEEKSGLLQCSHMGDDVEASLLNSE